MGIAFGAGSFLARAFALSAVVVSGGAGCVSLGQHQDTERKLEAVTAAYAGADAVIGRLKKENDLLKLKIDGLERLVATADQRAHNTSTVLAEYNTLQDKYQKLLQELKAGPSGGDIEINRLTNGVVLSDEIFFMPGKAELRTDKTEILDRLIARLGTPEFESAQIEIAGHTDSDPIQRSGWKDNYQLSSERARNILVHFLSKGVPESRLHIAGYGPTRPRSDKKSENRRVEVVLFDRK